jgi:hypothetical protein
MLSECRRGSAQLVLWCDFSSIMGYIQRLWR